MYDARFVPTGFICTLEMRIVLMPKTQAKRGCRRGHPPSFQAEGDDYTRRPSFSRRKNYRPAARSTAVMAAFNILAIRPTISTWLCLGLFFELSTHVDGGPAQTYEGQAL